MHENELSLSFTKNIPAVIRAYRTEIRAIAKLEFTTVQFRTLIFIGNGSGVTNREIAEHLGTLAPSVTRIVEGLCQDGYVIRARDEKDRREVRLRLTPKGKKRHTSLRNATRESFEKKFVHLSPTQRADLGRGLKVLEELFVR